MKSIFAYILLFLLLLPAVLKIGIVGNYLVQYEHYTTVLCENRDKPQMHCNGKCHLAQELKETSQTPESPAVPSALAQEPFFFFEHAHIPTEFVNRESKTEPHYLSFQHSQPTYAVPAQPPEKIILF